VWYNEGGRMMAGEVPMIETMIKSWWLLALCGVLDAIYAVMNFSHAESGIHYRATLVRMGMLALAAGACTIAAAIWSFRNSKSWLLVLNGVALSALGLILSFWRGRLAFRTVALLIVVMAISAGIFALVSARTLPGHVADRWLLSLAGVASVGFALGFLAFVFRLIKLDPGSPGQTLLWMGSYFGFSAIFMLALGLRLNSPGLSGIRT
jgi:uncharacterized membrane protein HdeD (DUF308 family)